MADNLAETSALASLLDSRLTEWERARKPQELKMHECYQDVMRIPRDDDTKDTGTAKSRKAKSLFIGSTRNKVRAARAKITDALFGNGKLPFDTTPTNEELAPFADVVEDILTEQLTRMKFRQLLSTGVNTLATYGTGFMFGPFVRKETLCETEADNSAGFTQIKETKYEFDFPYFELANTLDVYPDPESREIKSGLGTFWVTMESPHTVKAWETQEGYNNIPAALIGMADQQKETGSEIASQLRGNVEFWHKNGRIKVARFLGKIPKHMFPAAEPDAEVDPATEDLVAQDVDTGEMIDAIVIMAGGVIVKASESAYGTRCPTKRCTYEDVEHEIWGVGVAENNSPHQKLTNAAFRLFTEGKGMALLGTKAVDRANFLPTEDFKKYPGKVYQFKPGLSFEDKKASIIDFVDEDVTNGWIDVIRMSEQFSDDDTGITKYTQGDDSRNLNKTASGISMIMSASSLPLKEVIQHIDSNWIEEPIEDLIEWNIKYLEVETVQKIHGDKAAQTWAQIKQFGKTSFMEWQATGTSSFMQKEVLTNKIRAFSEFAMGNQITASLIDARELLEQTWDAMEVGKESPILKQEGDLKIPPQIEQQMKQMQDQVQQLGDALVSAHKEVDDKEEERKLEWYKARTDRLKVIGAGMTPEQVAIIVKDELHDILTAKDPDDEQPPTQPPDTQPPAAPPEPPPDQMQQDQMQPPQPPDGGFLTPESSPVAPQ